MRVFYQLPTKVVLIALILTWLGASATTTPATAYEREPMMDLKNGAVDFFIEVVPSIIQVYNGGGSGSGYIIDREAEKLLKKGRHEIIQKPFGKAELSRRIGDMLKR